MHPEIVARLAAIRHAELLAEAEHARLVAAVRPAGIRPRPRWRQRTSWKLAAAR